MILSAKCRHIIKTLYSLSIRPSIQFYTIFLIIFKRIISMGYLYEWVLWHPHSAKTPIKSLTLPEKYAYRINHKYPRSSIDDR